MGLVASLFDDFLEEFEPEELRDLCNSKAFRALAEYCARRHKHPPRDDDAMFDADELGIDPEE